MKLEEQVASLELCKKLKELGVKQESAFYWSHNEKECSYSLDSFVRHKEHFAALTVAELGRMLPFFIRFYKCVTGWDIEFKNDKNMSHWVSEATEANARAKMLIHLIEQGIVNPKES